MMQMESAVRSPFAAWSAHLGNPRLRGAFGIGFCILFAFIGTFTYVNFVLVRPPLSIGPMQLGFVYFVFLPSVVTTLLAGRAVHRWGTRPTLWSSLALAGVGLPLLLLPTLTAVLLGMVLVGVGTFFAQATATGLRSHRRPRIRERHLPRMLFCWRSGWRGNSWPNLRSDRMAGLRWWNRAFARGGSCFSAYPEDDPDNEELNR